LFSLLASLLHRINKSRFISSYRIGYYALELMNEPGDQPPIIIRKEKRLWVTLARKIKVIRNRGRSRSLILRRSAS
jgi:hypothetical protein